MTPDELSATPPTAVYLEVISVEPEQRPAAGRVRVSVRVGDSQATKCELLARDLLPRRRGVGSSLFAVGVEERFG